MIYRVRVDCWYERHGERRREVRMLLVEAETTNAARKEAEAYADKTAACGPDRYVGAEWMETWPVQLPVEIKGRIGQSSTFRNVKFSNLKRYAVSVPAQRTET